MKKYKKDAVIRGKKYGNSLHKAAIEKDEEDICRILEVDNGDSRFDISFSLCKAAGRGDIETCRSLLKNKADIESRKSLYSYTPLHNAAVSGHIEICELLLEHRADVHTIASGETPLRSAMRAGHSKICDLLLKHNADLVLKDEKRDGKLIKLKSQKLTEDLIVTSVEAIRAQRVDLAIPLDVSYMEMLPKVISATLDGYVIVDTFPSEIIGEMKPVLGRLDYQP